MRIVLHDLLNKIAIIDGQLKILVSEEKIKNNRLNRINMAIAAAVEVIKNKQKEITQNHTTVESFYIFLDSLIVSSRSLFGIDFKFIGDEITSPLMCNLDKLHSIFSNVIENSVNAGANDIFINVKKSNRWVEISMLDNGRGMTKEQIADLGFGFTIGGHGDGTRFIKSQAALMDADVRWDSQGLGFGSEFAIKLKLLSQA